MERRYHKSPTLFHVTPHTLKDADIPDDITVSGSQTLTTITASNLLAVQGTGTSTIAGNFDVAKNLI